MIRLFIADDHAILRGGLKQLFTLTQDITVAGEAEVTRFEYARSRRSGNDYPASGTLSPFTHSGTEYA
jgi:hypothetical protein